MVSPLQPPSKRPHLPLSVSSSLASSSRSGQDERIPISLSQVHKIVRDLPDGPRERIIPRESLTVDILETHRLPDWRFLREVFQSYRAENQRGRKNFFGKLLESWKNQKRTNAFNLLLLNKSGPSQNARDNALLQESLRQNHQQLFLTLLRTTEKPDLSPLIKRAVIDGNETLWPALREAVHEPLPAETMNWLAEYGQPEKLESLLEKMPTAGYPAEEKTTWRSLAQTQREKIEAARQQEPEDREAHLRSFLQTLATHSRGLGLRERALAEARERNDHPGEIQELEDEVDRMQFEKHFNENDRLNFLALAQATDIYKTLRPSCLHVLQSSIENGHSFPLKHLLSGRGVNMKDFECARFLMSAAAQNRNDMLQMLLNEPGADMHRFKSFPPLHSAALSGHTDVMTTLLNKPGIQINQPTPVKGYTPLHIASMGNQEEAVALLLNAPDIDVNAVDQQGQTALHHAAIKAFPGVVQQLLNAKGIDLNARDQEGRTPLQSTTEPAIRAALEKSLRHRDS